MKGIASLVIAFFWHYINFPMNGSEPPLYNLFPTLYSYGGLAVELFFTLSGYGMVKGYESRIYEGTIDFDTYLKRRISKIYPMFLETLILSLIINTIFCFADYNLSAYFDVYHFFLNVILLQSGIFEATQSFNGPGWFISVVMCMYVLFYIIVKRAGENKQPVKNLKYFYCCTAIAGGLLYMTGWNYPLLNSYIARGVLSFFIGCILAKFCIFSKEFTEKQKTVLGYSAIISLLVIYILIKKYGYEATIGNIAMFVPIVFVPLLIIGIHCVNWLNSLLSIKPFVHLGKISMSLYLIHHPIMCLIIFLNTFFDLQLPFNNVILWLIYIVIMIVLADINRILFPRFVNYCSKLLCGNSKA